MAFINNGFTLAMCCICASLSAAASASEQPTAIFHAFHQTYSDVKDFVCDLGAQGYSHVQIAPAQKSNPGMEWWARYQPVGYGVIEGRGSETDLRDLVRVGHDCQVKVIADVVFNHMADLGDCRDLRCFPGLSPDDFHPRCEINYADGNKFSEVNCWLGSLPDLIHNDKVQRLQKAHLKKLLDLGIDGFRFDAAKHMPREVVAEYVRYINDQSNGNAWNYLEVIEDQDTRAEDYNDIAAVTDFVLYKSMKRAFSAGGDLRSLRIPVAINDPRSVTFGQNHDTIRYLNPQYAIDPYGDYTDSYLATAYVLARANGTPLIFNRDNLLVPYIRYGVKFRQIIRQRESAGSDTTENVLAAIDSSTVLLMERGTEGFFVENKDIAKFDIPVLDLTLSKLEGCYRELRNRFTVAIERHDNGKKYVTRWATTSRGGLEVYGRDALYFVREGDRCGGN